MKLKSPQSSENHKTQFPNFSTFVDQKSNLRNYCIKNVKDGIQIGVYKLSKENVTNFSQFISIKVKGILRKSQAQFKEKLRKLKLMQNDLYITKKRF